MWAESRSRAAGGGTRNRSLISLLRCDFALFFCFVQYDDPHATHSTLLLLLRMLTLLHTDAARCVTV